MTQLLDASAQAAFRAAYPGQFRQFAHGLGGHPRLELDALADMAGRLPESSIEYNRGNLPVGVMDGPAPPNGLSIGETIRSIEVCDSWAVLKNIEQVPAYRDLLHELLAQIEPVITDVTGPMLHRQGFIFVSSPGSMTPFHFDPEHNILLQLRGSKTMTLWPAHDYRFAAQTAHEDYHRGGGRNLDWDDQFLPAGTEHALEPGQAVYVPVMAPHFVRNGPVPSVSLSITWRSEWSYAEADAHAMNAVLRRLGRNPRPPAAFPASDRLKANGWRALRKAGIVR